MLPAVSSSPLVNSPLDACQFAQSCQIELIDGDHLASLLRKLESRPDSAFPEKQMTMPPMVSESNTCPECGSPMTRRTAKSGPLIGQDFLGCTRYPECRSMRQIAPL